MEIVFKAIAAILRAPIKYRSKKSFPKIDNELNITDINKDVTITRDIYGIPHIKGESLEDVVFAQGYIHAQDRLWQMELNRRTARGQLSEIFGRIALDTDRTARTFGFNRLAQKDYEILSDLSKNLVTAYVNGINQYLEDESLVLPVEFSLIKHKPKPWDYIDVLALSRLMMWQLSHSWYSKLIRADIITKVGKNLALELEINSPNEEAIILPEGINFNVFDSNGILKKLKGPFLEKSMGSNSIAISGKFTESGKPILANDVHLAISTPSLWYINHLEHLDNFCVGVTVPGLPMVLIGENKYFGWTATLAFTDCADVYIEKLDRKRKTYEYKGEQRSYTSIKEEIKVKDKKRPVHNEEIIETEHGLIISDILNTGEYVLAVKDTALDPSTSMDGFFKLNLGKNWNDFVSAVKTIRVPQLNLNYADIEGNIGYWCTGEVPIRANGKSYEVPVPGWTGDYEWTGFVPFEEMPHALNPEQGYIVTTNNKIIPDDFPHYLGNVWMNGYRGTVITKQIEDLINDGVKISPLMVNKMMFNIYCLPAVELSNHIAGLDLIDRDVQKAKTILTDWNKEMSKESIGATLYEVIRYTLVKNLLTPKLGNDLTETFMGKGFDPVLLASHEFYGHDTTVLLNLLNNEKSQWIEQAGGKETILRKSIKEALSWLSKELGPIRDDWKWGKIHQALFPHAFDIQKPLNYIFNPKAIPVDGNTDTPKQTAMHPNLPYHNRAWSISFRLLIDFSNNLESTKMIIAPGQSGLLGHKHYDDLIDRWDKGDNLPLFLTQEQIDKNKEGKIILRKTENG